MRQTRRYFLYCWLAIAAACSGAVNAEPIPEYDIKAAFLYNFTLFTEWPALSEKNIRLCVVGTNPFGNRLDELTRKSSKHHKLTVQYLGSLSNIGNCQILFVTESERIPTKELLAAVEKLPILTISDDRELFEYGMMVGLFLERNRIVFDINYTSVRNASLSMSSRLLQLARKVY